MWFAKFALVCLTSLATFAFEFKIHDRKAAHSKLALLGETRIGSAITLSIRDELLKVIEYSAVFYGSDAASGAKFISNRLTKQYPGMWNVLIVKNIVNTSLDTTVGYSHISDGGRWWLSCGNCNRFAPAWSYFISKTLPTSNKFNNYTSGTSRGANVTTDDYNIIKNVMTAARKRSGNYTESAIFVSQNLKDFDQRNWTVFLASSTNDFYAYVSPLSENWAAFRPAAADNSVGFAFAN